MTVQYCVKITDKNENERKQNKIKTVKLFRNINVLLIMYMRTYVPAESSLPFPCK